MRVHTAGALHAPPSSPSFLPRQLLLVLAERLCSGYPKDSQVRKLVDSIDLYIIPTMNPDGFDAHKRENK